MARFNFLGRAVDTYGNIQPNVGITIYLTGTSTPATVYTQRAGGAGVSTLPQITTDIYGAFNFYVDEVDYPLAGNQKFDVLAAGLKYSDIEIMRGVKVHHALEELLDDDHPQYAALAQNETIIGNWTFSHPISGQNPTKNIHLTTKYYVNLQILSVSAASDEADQHHKEWADTMFTSVSAASKEQDNREHEQTNVQILSVSAASDEADNRLQENIDINATNIATNVTQILSVSAVSDIMFASVSAASHEQDNRERETTNVQILSVSAVSHEQDNRERETTNVQILSVSAVSHEQDNRLQENIDINATNILSVSATSIEQDNREREQTNVQIFSVSAASDEADNKLQKNIDINATNILSVSGVSLERDNKERETTNVQILSVSATSIEQDNREREQTNVQILSVSAASIEQDNREREQTNVQIFSVSAASDEADNRLQEYTNDLVNTNILSVSAASDEADQRLQEYVDDELNNLSLNKIYEGNSGVVVNDTGTGTINISADGETIATFKSGELDINGNIKLPSDNTSGIVYKGNNRFIHNYNAPGQYGSNTFVGINSGNTTMTGPGLADGSFNTALGRNTLRLNEKGMYNVAIGLNSLEENTDGDTNFGIGADAFRYNKLGCENVGIGNQAGRGVTGNSDIYRNTLIGYQSGLSLRTGANNNILIGYAAGDNIINGERNILIGYSIDAAAPSGDYQLSIGDTIYGDLNTKKINLTHGIGINEFSIDGTLAGDSDDAVPTEKAVKTYVDSVSAASVEQDKKYLLVDGSRAMAGNLSMDDYDITDVDNLSFSDNRSEITLNNTHYSHDITLGGSTLAGSGNDWLSLTQLFFQNWSDIAQGRTVNTFEFWDDSTSSWISSASEISKQYGAQNMFDGEFQDNIDKKHLMFYKNQYSKFRITYDVTYDWTSTGALAIFKGWVPSGPRPFTVMLEHDDNSSFTSSTTACKETISEPENYWNYIPCKIHCTERYRRITFEVTDWETSTYENIYIIRELSSFPYIGGFYRGRPFYTDGEKLKLRKGGTSVNEFSTDGTLAGNSDDAVPTEKAVKTYSDNISAASVLVKDATPQLGGDLDMNSKGIDFPSTANITDCKDEDNMASDSATMLATQQSIKKYVDDNKVATAGIVVDATPQLGGDLDMNAKGIDFPTTANITDCLDEDSMVSDSATKLVTQQSVKAYVDSMAGTSSGCRVYRNAVQSIPDSTWTKLQFNAEDYDNQNEYDNTTNYRFTAKIAGVYQVSATCVFGSIADAKRIIISIYKNGTEYSRGVDMTTGTATYPGPHISTTVKLAVNDYIDTYVYQTNGAPVNTQATIAECHMIVQKITAASEHGSAHENSSYVKVSDVKANTTDAGTFTAGAWRTRVLNTEDSDPDGICSLASNQITLSAGTYECRISAPANACGPNQIKLRNTTDSTDLLIGQSTNSVAAAAYAVTHSVIVGRFTIAASKALEVQHKCTTTRNTDGLGRAASTGTNEVYTVAEFWKISETGWANTVGFSSRARAYLGTNQSINASTWTKIELDTETYDGLGEFDSITNHRFVASSAGYYMVVAQVAYETETFPDGVRYLTKIYKNGSGIAMQDKTTGGIAHCTGNITTMVYLAANEYLELYVYQITGVAKNATSADANTYMAIHRLS